jgi:hypothetical protein
VWDRLTSGDHPATVDCAVVLPSVRNPSLFVLVIERGFLRGVARRRHREDETQTDRDDHDNGNPHARNAIQNARAPQRDCSAYQQRVIDDEIRAEKRHAEGKLLEECHGRRGARGSNDARRGGK